MRRNAVVDPDVFENIGSLAVRSYLNSNLAFGERALGGEIWGRVPAPDRPLKQFNNLVFGLSANHVLDFNEKILAIYLLGLLRANPSNGDFHVT